MKNTVLMAALAAAALATGCGQGSSNQGGTDRNASETARDRISSETSDKQPDNTGVNKRDRSDQTLTAGDQANNETDREITRNIRRAITKDDQLSTTAKNIKIITANGKTTLRGPVKSEQEKEQILAAAKGVQGVGEVDNQLEVKNQTNKIDQ